jgi:hypothetical protein
MENRTTTIDRDLSGQINSSFFLKEHPREVLEELAIGGHKSFVDYVTWLGVAKDKNFIVLTPSHHYYYDDDDMKDVKTVLNLQQLNHIKQVKGFLHTIFRMLPPESYFVGSFIDRKYQFGFFSSPTTTQPVEGTLEENGIASRIPILNMMYSIIDSRTNRNLTKKIVALLLEDAGLKVLDMTEINGLTCFCAQKIRSSAGYE